MPCLSQGDLPNPGTKPGSPMSQAGSLSSEPPGKPQSSFIQSLNVIIHPNWSYLSCFMSPFMSPLQSQSHLWLQSLSQIYSCCPSIPSCPSGTLQTYLVYCSLDSSPTGSPTNKTLHSDSKTHLATGNPRNQEPGAQTACPSK